MKMASTLLSGSVSYSPAAGGYGFRNRRRPLHGGNTCRFVSKRPASYPPLRASPPSSTAVIADPPSPATSPPPDFNASPLPLLLLPPDVLNKRCSQDTKPEEKEDKFTFYSISKMENVTVEKSRRSWRRDQIRDAHWIGSSKGWVMCMNRRDCNLYLFNPLSPSTSPIIPLPPIESLEGVSSRNFRRRKSCHDVTDRSSTVLDFEFVLEDWFEYDDESNKKWFEVSLPYRPSVTAPAEELVNKGFISKISVSSDLTSPSSNYEDLRNCIVAITYGLSDKLAVCRLGDRIWTSIDGSGYKEIMFSRYENLKLFVVTRAGHSGWCQLNPTNSSQEWYRIPDVPNVVDEVDVPRDELLTYLVESATEPDHMLIVTTRSYCDDNYAYMHKLNLSDPNPKKTWARVKHLEDQTLFIGDFSETLSVPAAQLPPKVNPSYIYYSNFRKCELGVLTLEDSPKDLDEEIEAYKGLLIDFPPKQRFSYRIWMERYRKDSEGWLLWVAPHPW